MRLAPLLALLLATSALHAQTVPDPTPPADYYPLEVGNEWVYRYAQRSPAGDRDVFERRRVLRTEAVGGQTYAVDQECVYDNLAATPAWVCAPERLVRFDPATTNVVVREADGERVAICALGADFGEALPDGCTARAYTDVGPAMANAVQIGGVAYAVARIKAPATVADPGPPPFAAGIGPLEQEGTGPLRTERFEFARVRGVEYGQRPVAGEADVAPAEALALTAAPNPTAGALRLALALPAAQTVRLEAFDALGRRVWQQTATLGAGAQTIAVDASAWAPGVYVVRAVAGTRLGVGPRRAAVVKGHGGRGMRHGDEPLMPFAPSPMPAVR